MAEADIRRLSRRLYNARLTAARELETRRLQNTNAAMWGGGR